jgi:drug/metabolite transporter (DMT)-like permease
MKGVLSAALCALLLAIAQICWKFTLGDHKLSFQLSSITALLFSRLFVAGAVLYIIATAYWMYLLQKYEVSYIYPLMSSAFLFSNILAILFLHEHISFLRWFGVSIIIVGIVIVGINK